VDGARVLIEAALRSGPQRRPAPPCRSGAGSIAGRPIHLLLVIGAALLSSGCLVLGPIWAEGVSGRVVDSGDESPVSNAAVLYSYEQTGPRVGGGIRRSVCVRHTITDESGRYHFPGRVCLAPYLLEYTRTNSDPSVTVFHHGYFTAGNTFGWIDESVTDELVIRVQRGQDGFSDPPDLYRLCRSADEKTCDALCEWAFGAEACAELGQE